MRGRDPQGQRVEDLPELLRGEIEQFFSIYKDLERKNVIVDGWASREQALREIQAARKRLRAAPAGPRSRSRPRAAGV